MSLDCCPHCGRPGLFPNVRFASQTEECEALQRRYEAAEASADERGCTYVFKDLERAASRSRAVIADDHLEVLRLSSSEDRLYSTYYQQIEAHVRLPSGDKWDSLREIADAMLFGQHKSRIHHAALSLDDVGVMNYGDVSMVLADEMISHRTSVLEENSVHFAARKVADPNDIPVGYRARWEDRSLLCAAKLGCKLEPKMADEDLVELLIQQGDTTAEDKFVEAHVGGPISARTLVKAIVTSPINTSLLERLRIQLEPFGVEVEVRGWTP